MQTQVALSSDVKVEIRELTPRDVASLLGIVKDVVSLTESKVKDAPVDLSGVFDKYETVVSVANKTLTFIEGEVTSVEDLPFSDIEDTLLPAIMEVNKSFLDRIKHLGLDVTQMWQESQK